MGNVIIICPGDYYACYETKDGSIFKVGFDNRDEARDFISKLDTEVLLKVWTE